MKFSLMIDIAHHPHSPSAHRQIIAQMLDCAKQQVGVGPSTEGSLIYGAAFQQEKIGSWEITGEPERE